MGVLILKPALLDLRQAREVTDYNFSNPRAHHNKYHNHLIHCYQQTNSFIRPPSYTCISDSSSSHYDLHQNNTYTNKHLLIITTIIFFVYVFILDRVLSCIGG